MSENTRRIEDDFAIAERHELEKKMLDTLKDVAGIIARFEGRTEPTPQEQGATFLQIFNNSNQFNERLSQAVEQVEKPALLRIGSARVCTPGSVSLIIGAPKSRKTSLATLIANAILSRAAGSGLLSSDTANNQLLWVDTEQDEFFTYKGGQFIIDGELELTKQLRYIELANYSRKERLLYSLTMLAYQRPQFAIFDGIGDMMEGVNDEVKAGNLFDILNYFAKEYDMHILCALHTNGQEDARGHVGRELQRKCETTILCRVVGDDGDRYTEVVPKYCRNGEFEKFNIRHTNGKVEVFNGYQNSIHDIWKQAREYVEQLEVKTAKNIASVLREVVTLEHGNQLTQRQAERAVQELNREKFLKREEYTKGSGFTYTIEK